MTAADLCAQLVRIPTAFPDSVEPAIALCLEALQPAGFRLLHRAETAPGVVHALLERPGEDPPFLIDAHLDTVPVGDPARWTRDPLGGDLRDGAIWGRGAADTKGPLAAALAALRGATPRRRILLTLGGDEETDMAGICALRTHPAVQAATQALVLEPTGGRPVHAHKGCSRIRVDVRGHAAHASRPWEGCNAVEEKIRLIRAVAEEFAAGEGARRVASFGDEPGTLVITREYTPNAAFNVLPDLASYWYNFRPLPGLANLFSDFVVKVEEQARCLGIEARVEVEFSVPPLLTPVEAPLIRACAALCDAPAGWVAYGTHAGHLVREGRDVLVFGPGDIAQAHREDEYITFAALEAGERVISGLILQCAG